MPIVIGSTKYLGYGSPFFATQSKRREKQQVLAYRGEPSEIAAQEPNSVQLSPCAKRLCHHRDYTDLAVCLHTLCYDLLNTKATLNEGHQVPTSMQALWQMGRSTLWSLVPNSRSAFETTQVGLVASSLQGADFTRLLSKANRCLVTDEHKTLFKTVDLYQFLLKLPNELQLMVFNYVPYHVFFSPALILEQSRPLLKSLRDPSRNSINLASTEAIFLGRVRYRNSDYVTTLNSHRLSPSDNQIQRDSQTMRLHVVTDDVGIREIVFIAKGAPVSGWRNDSPGNGLWFKTLRLNMDQPINQLDYQNDDLFLRDLDVGQELCVIPPFKNVLEWNAPQEPTINPTMCYRTHPLRKCEGPARMRLMSLVPSARGIVAAETARGIFALYAWHPEVEHRKIYDHQLYFDIVRENHPYPKWTFFPMTAEEQILDVFIREKPTKNNLSFPALVILTTSGRSYTFGPYIDPTYRIYYRFIPLKERADGVVSDFFFNEIGWEQNHIVDLGIACRPYPDVQIPSLSPQQPIFPGMPEGAPCSEWFASSASLANILRIQKCYNTVEEIKACMGLLIHYRDGTCDSLGQWRWDHEIEDCQQVEGDHKVFGFKLIEKGRRTRIQDVTLVLPSPIDPNTGADKADDLYQWGPFEGTIVWWCSLGR
ncbi:MAG: hypothetical protein Q9170_005716, partial [Blastenia crenularia]